MSKLVMKNNINSELSITHVDNKPAKSIIGTDIAVAVDTINDFPLDASDGDTVIVRDLDRGGTFIYDSSKVAEHNNGTNFNGWIRQYSGAVNVKWFGAVGDYYLNSSGDINTTPTDNTNSIQAAINTNEPVYIENGDFYISSSIVLKSNSILYGSGVTDKGYYAGSFVKQRKGTNIVLAKGITGITCNGISTANRSVSIRLKDFTISVDGAEQGTNFDTSISAIYEPNTIGINITGFVDSEISNVGFFNLDKGILAEYVSAGGSQYTARVTISKCEINNCNVGIKTDDYNDTVNATNYADFSILDCPFIGGNNTAFVLDRIDGVLLSNSIIFPSQLGVTSKNTTGIKIFNTTFFETQTSANLTIDSCKIVNINGVSMSRSGWLGNSSVPNINILNSENVYIQGELHESGGSAINIAGSSNVKFNGLVSNSCYVNSNSAIFISSDSNDITVFGKISTVDSAIYSVYSQSTSNDVSGLISSNKRIFSNVNLKNNKEIYLGILKPTASTDISSGLTIYRKNIIVPAGYKVVLRYLSFYFNDTHFTGRVGGYSSSVGGASNEYPNEVLFDNTSNSAELYQLYVTINNLDSSNTYQTNAIDTIEAIVSISKG